MSSMLRGVRDYPGVGADVAMMTTQLETLFLTRGYTHQAIAVAGGMVLQARKTSMFRTAIGLDYALTIQITVDDQGTHVHVGGQRWFEKAAVGTVAFMLGGPAVVLPAAGAYFQRQITEEAWQVIERHIAHAPGLARSCRSCGSAINHPAARFCSACGGTL